MKRHTAFLLLVIVTVIAPGVAIGPPLENTIDGPMDWQSQLQLAVSQATLQQNLRELRTTARNSETRDEQNDASASVQHIDISPALPTEREEEERGYRLFQTDRGDVRFEVYMGEQPTTGHDVEITEIARYGDILNIGVRFKHPDSSQPVVKRPTYPAAAARFTLPDGTYRVNVQIEEQRSAWFGVSDVQD